MIAFNKLVKKLNNNMLTSSYDFFDNWRRQTVEVLEVISPVINFYMGPNIHNHLKTLRKFNLFIRNMNTTPFQKMVTMFTLKEAYFPYLLSQTSTGHQTEIANLLRENLSNGRRKTRS